MSDVDLYRLFKTLHVIAVVALGGGFVLEALAGPLVARARSVQEVRAYARMIYISENFLSPAAAVFIFIFGAATADRGNIDFDRTWLALGIVLFLAIVVLAVAFLRPAANRLHALAQAAPDGPVTAEIAAQLRKPAAPVVGAVTSVLFIFIIYLMVARPAW
jgi:uncharacterized membrane protein